MIIMAEASSSSSSSLPKDQWSRKRKLVEKAELMREAKRKGRQQGESSSVAPETAESSTAETAAMDQDVLISENSDSISESKEEEAELDQQKAQELFDDWMASLRLDQRRMLGVISMESFKCRQGMNVKDAAQEAGSIVGFNKKTVRRHRNDFSNNKRLPFRVEARKV